MWTVARRPYDELEAVRLTRNFLDAPERYLRAALDDSRRDRRREGATGKGSPRAGAPHRLQANRAEVTGVSTRLAAVVDASIEVAATRARSTKVRILAELLRSVGPDEVAICVGFLSGAARQGRVGVGYRTVYGIDVPPPAEPSLTIADLDRAIDEVAADSGPGSATRRRQLLTELLRQATEPEAEFIRRLLTGDLRQGALAGVMADAVAEAAGVSAGVARRALMLTGDLTRMAEIAISSGEEGLRAVGLELFRPIQPMLAAPGQASTRRWRPSPVARWSSSSTGSGSRSTVGRTRFVSTRATSTTSPIACRASSPPCSSCRCAT